MPKPKKEDLFDRLYETHGKKLYNTAVLITHDRQMAEEAMQDAYMAAYRDLDRVLRHDNPLAWLLAVVNNKATDLVRAASRQPRPLDDATLQGLIASAPNAGGDPHDQAERRALHEQAQEWLADLNDDQRQVVVLVYYAGLTIREAAEVLHVPLGTVKSRLHRGLQALGRMVAADPHRGGKEVARFD